MVPDFVSTVGAGEIPHQTPIEVHGRPVTVRINGMQQTALRAVADAERYTGPRHGELGVGRWSSED
jgi:hypothetical protein